MTLSQGTRLGRYTVVEHVGTGSTAEVYRGRDELGRAVAVKLLVGTTELARSEAEVMAALRHPNIVTTLDILATDGRICLVQEWIDGGSVAAELESAGRLSLEATVRMGRDVASALAYAHQHGILHRDIKPSNVLRTAGGDYKLLDFGAGGRLRPDTAATRAGEIAGTPLYMSVEQITGAPQTAASDLFGFGLLLYRCLHGHLPDETADSYLHLLQSRMRRPISVPPSPLQGLLTRCLALDPKQRPRSAQEVLAELDRISISEPTKWWEAFHEPKPQPSARPVSARPGSPRPSDGLPAAGRVASTRTGTRAVRLASVVAAVVLLGSGLWLLGVQRSLGVGAGLAVVSGALLLAGRVRRRWADRAPEVQERAATILFGAGQRAELTQSLMIEVDQVVKNLNSLDARFLGMTVVAMIREYEEARDSSQRQTALLNVVALMEKLQAHLSPWHVRHRDAIATIIAVVGSLVGVAGVVGSFLK